MWNHLEKVSFNPKKYNSQFHKLEYLVIYKTGQVKKTALGRDLTSIWDLGNRVLVVLVFNSVFRITINSLTNPPREECMQSNQIQFHKLNLTHEFGYSILVKTSNILHENDHFREFVTKLNTAKMITFEHHFHWIPTKITVYDVLEPNMVWSNCIRQLISATKMTWYPRWKPRSKKYLYVTVQSISYIIIDTIFVIYS